jgi:5-methylcytosine-specific restriction endonuclease McrA
MPSKLAKIRHTAYQNQHGHCHYCSSPMWLDDVATFAALFQLTTKQARLLQCTAEHLHARQDGGQDTAANIVAACWYCNTRRHKCRSAVPSPDVYRKRIRHQVQRGKWLPKGIMLNVISKRATAANGAAHHSSKSGV